MISLCKLMMIFLASTLALTCASAQAQSLKSGIYIIDKPAPSGQSGRQLYLAVNGANITGYYDQALSRQYDASLPDPTCRFFLSGTLSNKTKIELKTWYPASTGAKAIEGDTLNLTVSDATHWVIHLSDDATLANCDVSTLVNGDAMSLKNSQPWNQIEAVISARSHLYSEPDDNHRERSYIVRGNAVAVSQESSDWVFATYIDTVKNNVSGWMPREALMYPH